MGDGVVERIEALSDGPGVLRDCQTHYYVNRGLLLGELFSHGYRH